MVGRTISFRDAVSEKLPSMLHNIRSGWAAVAVVFVAGFSMVGFGGSRIYDGAPPIPSFRVKDGDIIFRDEDVMLGQEIWQSIGGQQVGSIWGHGALQAPDWSADWLHREAVATMEEMAGNSSGYVAEVRANTYDAATGEAWITPTRAKAVTALADYYVALFTGEQASQGGEDLRSLRSLYAIKDITLNSTSKARSLAAFVFWTSWAAATQRPGMDVTYTNNWPAERLVGNVPPPDTVIWSMASVALLVGGIGLLGWSKARTQHSGAVEPPDRDPLADLVVTPSMLSMQKWAWTVVFLQGFQICLGVYIAHISVNGPLGIPLCITQNLTYTVARTWHLQAAVFSIAASFLGAGLFMAPMIGGWKKDPPLQHLLANVLFLCLLVIVVGSFAGQLASVLQAFESLRMSQLFGHQGYEFVDLGRFWQIFLCVGLVIWLALMINGIWPAILGARPSKDEDPADARGHWNFVAMLTLSAVLIALFYTSGLLIQPRTNLAVMDYWRFWIVHMWVEGIFEVFITVVVAYIFMKLGVLDATNAAGASLFTTGVFLFGGIPGMFHHNYFSGSPPIITAIGACFSALEVCPLALMGFEVAEYAVVRRTGDKRGREWLAKYKPIVDCLVYVAFWNMVGAGFLGFLINPPLSLYYMQGGYLTLSHSHGALWGVYGVLAIALCLLILRLSDLKAKWNTWSLDLGLLLLNVGMVLQIFLSLFPIGLYQFWTAVHYDYWYARSQHFHGDPAVQWLKLGRSIGDSTFALGMLLVLYFVARLAFDRFFGKAQQSGVAAPLL